MENEKWKHIPLIFISALMSEKDQLQGFKAGATDYLTKPFSTKILQEKVYHWIMRRQYETLMNNTYLEVESNHEQLSSVKSFLLHELKNVNYKNSLVAFHLNQQYEEEIKENFKLPDNFETQLSQAMDSLHSLNTVIGSLKKFSDFDLADLQKIKVTDLFQSIKHRSSHLMNNITLTDEIKVEPDVCINCNKEMLTHAIFNIIKNVTKALQETEQQGVIHFSLMTYIDKQFNRYKPHCEFKITDNGTGMSKKQQDKLFEVKHTTKKDGEGIGLHFVKMIVKLHKGWMEIKSEEGKGSEFAVSFPIELGKG